MKPLSYSALDRIKRNFQGALKAPIKKSPRPLREIAVSFVSSAMVFTVLMFFFQFIKGEHGAVLIASFGASTILCVCTPDALYGQPRNVLLGNMLAAFAGVSSHLLFGDSPQAAIFSVAAAGALMHITDTMHPPGGATALLAVLGSPEVQALGYYYVFMPVGLGSLVLVVLALILNNLVRPHSYPLYW